MVRQSGSARLHVVMLCAWTALLAAQAPGAFAQHNKARANSYDDTWEDVALGNASWVFKARNILAGATGKTPGFVLQIGDSITHSNPYSQWPRYGSGQTSEDQAVVAWCNAATWGTGNTDTSNKNGWYLAAADTTGNRGMTASSGIDTAEYLSGTGNGGTAMPNPANPGATPKQHVADTAINANLHMATVAAAFPDAQFAVLMLGTNDASGSRSETAFEADLGSLIDALEAQDIVVILSTIPPHWSSTLEDGYNARIRQMAQSRALALVDYHAEILQRRPTTWNGTLLQTNNVHPTANDGAGNGSASNPYLPGGDPATHTTGDNCLNIGYLLRSWLTIQKLKEVKDYVIDLNDPPSSGNPNPPANLTATAGNGSVLITWSASAGATGYNVYRSTTSGTGYGQIGTSAGTSFTDTTAVNGTTYYYVVTAVTPESGYSNEDSATPTASSGGGGGGGGGGGCGATGVEILLALALLSGIRRRL